MAANNSLYKNNSYNISNVSKRNLAKVLIEFMNLQTPDVRTKLTEKLCGYHYDGANRLSCYMENGESTKYYISQNIDNGKLTFNMFLSAIKQLKDQGIKYNGFRNINTNYKSLPENSNERKLNKYKGMINCCLLDNDKCTDTRKTIQTTFLGFRFGPAKTEETCTISGGTRKKRRTRSTKKHRRKY